MEDKAISPVVGMIMVLAIIAGFMSIIQTQQLPQWNKQKEAEHYKLLVSEFSRIPYILSTGTTASISLDAGLDYPDIPLLINPPDAVSTLKFEKRNVTISYTLVTPSGQIPVPPKNYSSTAIVLKPHYFYSSERELVLEHGIIFEKWGSKQIPITEQITFTKSRINLPIINATSSSFATSTVSLKLTPVSYGGEIMAKNLTITFETSFPSWWNTTLSELNFSVVEGVNNVTVHIPEAVILDVSEWELGGSGKTLKEYMKPDRLIPFKPNISVSAGSIERIDVQVIDEYGNPIPNILVNASISGDIGTLDARNVTTNTFGVATFYLTAPTNATTGRISFTADGVSTSVNVSVVEIGESYTVDYLHANGTYKYEGFCNCWKDVEVNVITHISPAVVNVTVAFTLTNEDGVAVGSGVAPTNDTGWAQYNFYWYKKKRYQDSITEDVKYAWACVGDSCDFTEIQWSWG